MYHQWYICRNLHSSYMTDLSTNSGSIASDQRSLTLPSSKRLFPIDCRFFLSLSPFFSHSHPSSFSTLQRITHLTGFYFVRVFPCYLPCRRQMGTKSRQRKVIFEFSCFHARLPVESFFFFLGFFFSSTCMSCMPTRSFFLWVASNPWARRVSNCSLGKCHCECIHSGK